MTGLRGKGVPSRFPHRGKRLFLSGFLLGLVAGMAVSGNWTEPHSDWTSADRSHLSSGDSAGDWQPGPTVESSMEEVLQIAREALAHLYQHVDDYTATLVQQESTAGVLGEPHQMELKVQCRHRGPNRDDSEPFRVYLRFERPRSVAGREVIWAEDMYDAKMVVHEGGLLGLMTVRLEPTGMLAMRGQRYPIYEIGLTNLVKKLIEKGEQDRDNPDLSVTITPDYDLDGQRCDMIVVTRRTPSGDPDDFSRVEICFDRQRHLPLRYTAYGWPAAEADVSSAPLMESYTYRNVQTNVGLSESDFDHKNPGYQFR